MSTTNTIKIIKSERKSSLRYAIIKSQNVFDRSFSYLNFKELIKNILLTISKQWTPKQQIPMAYAVSDLFTSSKVRASVEYMKKVKTSTMISTFKTIYRILGILICL